jgi:hypothetical protein
MKMGSYKVCRKCLAPIQRNGVEIYKISGRKNKIIGYFHAGCFNQVSKRYNTKYLK